MVLAAPALGQQTKDVDSLIKDLKNDNSTIRANAAESLGEIKDKRAVEPLIQLSRIMIAMYEEMLHMLSVRSMIPER